MTAAAIQASYSDFKLIKSRSQAQIVLEIPIENAEAFLKAFGVPQPGHEKPVAIALLNLPTDKPEQPKAVPAGGKRWHEMSRAQQAGVLCSDPGFQKWAGVSTTAEAAEYVREHCDVVSRADLDRIEWAGSRWDSIVTTYRLSTHGMAEQRG